MDILDEKGRLFGVVNVVDALVVLLAVAVVAAGAALVLGQGDAPDGSSGPALTATHATLDTGTQPDYIVSQLAEGDRYSPGGNDNLTITDVRLEPRPNGDTAATLRVRLESEAGGSDTFQYDGAPPRLGRDLQIATDQYQVSGTVTDVGEDSAVPTTERDVLAVATVDPVTAADIAEGDEFVLRERTIGTVRSVEVFGTNESDERRVRLGLTLEARVTESADRFAGVRLTEGATVPFRTSEYNFDAEIQRVGTTEPRGEPATRTVTLRLADVAPELADAVTAGMNESTNGNTVAEITDVDRTPATVVLTMDGGDVYEREHPRNVDVTVTADLAVRETVGGVSFKGEPVQYGDTVVLDLGSVTVQATVTSI